MKDHYTCTAFARGVAKHGCHKKIEAPTLDVRTLKRAGWEHDGNYNRDRWKCPACKSSAQKREKKMAKFIVVWMAATNETKFKALRERAMSAEDRVKEPEAKI